MSVEAHRALEIELTMTERSARWLMAYLQNPNGVKPEEEEKEDTEMRCKFFVAIKDALDG